MNQKKYFGINFVGRWMRVCWIRVSELVEPVQDCQQENNEKITYLQESNDRDGRLNWNLLDMTGGMLLSTCATRKSLHAEAMNMACFIRSQLVTWS